MKETRPPLRREDVIDAAMDVLNEHGLDSLTTRRLADRLGIRVAAVYWHIKNKRELLIALTDRIVAEALPDDVLSDDWPSYLAQGAHRLRSAMLRHRDGARLIATYAAAAPTSRHLAAEGLGGLLARGFTLADAAYAGDTIMSYVAGFVLQEQAEQAPAQEAEHELSALSVWERTKPAGKDVAFATGIELIIAGIGAVFASASTPPDRTASPDAQRSFGSTP